MLVWPHVHGVWILKAIFYWEIWQKTFRHHVHGVKQGMWWLLLTYFCFIHMYAYFKQGVWLGLGLRHPPIYQGHANRQSSMSMSDFGSENVWRRLEYVTLSWQYFVGKTNGSKQKNIHFQLITYWHRRFLKTNRKQPFMLRWVMLKHPWVWRRPRSSTRPGTPIRGLYSNHNPA